MESILTLSVVKDGFSFLKRDGKQHFLIRVALERPLGRVEGVTLPGVEEGGIEVRSCPFLAEGKRGYVTL